MVKEAIEPSGSVAPNPAIGAMLLGGIARLTFVTTGGRFGGGSSTATVAVAGLAAPRLSVAL